MFKDAFHTSQGLDHVRSVVVQVPQFPIMTLVCPIEVVLSQLLVSFKVLAGSPPLVVCESVPVLLEQRIDARDPPVP